MNMKKLFLLLSLLVAFGLPGISQTGIYSGGVSTVAQHDLRKTGWIVRPEIGGMCNVYFDRIRNVGVGVNIGYQLSPSIYLGGGMNCLVRPDGTYDNYSGIYGHDNLETLFASARWYWFDGRSSPFVELNAGFGRFAFHYNWDSGNSHTRGALFAIPAIGFDIRNINFKLGAQCSTNDVPFDIYLMFGYNYLIKEKETTRK